MPAVRMIAVDMDGTLLGADGKVSARNLAAMHAAEQAGIEVVVATGRRHCFAMRQLRGLGLNEANALVSSNGTVTRTVGAKLIERNLLAEATALWLCDHLEEFRNALVVTFDKVRPDGEDERGALVVEHLEGRVEHLQHLPRRGNRRHAQAPRHSHPRYGSPSHEPARTRNKTRPVQIRTRRDAPATPRPDTRQQLPCIALQHEHTASE